MHVASIAAVLVAVVAWLVSARQLNVITGLVFIAACASAVLAVARLMPPASHSDPVYWRVRRVVIVLVAMTIALEMLLRLAGTYRSYSERASVSPMMGTYLAGFGTSTRSWFHVYSPHITVSNVRAEFSFSTTTNSLGFCEREVADAEESGKLRIMALGDSFTEGVGAPDQASWPRALEQRLNQQAAREAYTVFNAGIGGSDPWFEYMLLRDKLASLAPRLVIVAINSSDINDVMIRGGMERFRPDRTTQFLRQPPPWEWLYGISYVTRHVVHDVFSYDFFFIRAQDLERERNRAVDDIVKAVNAFRKLSRERGFGLLILTHPDRNEAFYNHYDASMLRLIAELNQLDSLHTVDLLQKWQRVLAEGSADRFYWPIDGHHNSEGYLLLGSTVADVVMQLQPAPVVMRASEPR